MDAPGARELPTITASLVTHVQRDTPQRAAGGTYASGIRSNRMENTMQGKPKLIDVLVAEGYNQKELEAAVPPNLLYSNPLGHHDARGRTWEPDGQRRQERQ